MAGILPSFLSGSTIVIRIGTSRIAYCQNLRYGRNVAHAPISGVGSYSIHALEPVDYSAGGSMQILRYTSAAVFGNDATGGVGRNAGQKFTLPDNMQNMTEDPKRNGNSMIDELSFNPQKLLLSYTFDIDVFERQANVVGGLYAPDDTGALMYTFKDCRLTGYSYNFAPGELLIESVDFVCRNIIDRVAQAGGTSEEQLDQVTLT